MGTISDDVMYCSQQINVPLNLPYILKQYAKAAIKTQPRDLLHWSSVYFRALANGEVPPVKDRIEFPLISTPSGLTPGYLKILIKQFGKHGIIEEKELKKKWSGVGLESEELQNMLKLCGFRKSVRWQNFIAVAAGFLSPNLTQTMILVCELLTDEPEGGSAAILLQTFMTLYMFLARMDCGPVCHLKESLDVDISSEESSEIQPVHEESVESVKSTEKIEDVEVALEEKPSEELLNAASKDVMVWEDVTEEQSGPKPLQEKIEEAHIGEENETKLPVDIIDTSDKEDKDEKESVKSTESYDNTGITLKFHDPEQDVKIDDYTGPIDPKLKKRYAKKFEERAKDTENEKDTEEVEGEGSGDKGELVKEEDEIKDEAMKVDETKKVEEDTTAERSGSGIEEKAKESGEENNEEKDGEKIKEEVKEGEEKLDESGDGKENVTDVVKEEKNKKKKKKKGKHKRNVDENEGEGEKGEEEEVNESDEEEQSRYEYSLELEEEEEEKGEEEEEYIGGSLKEEQQEEAVVEEKEEEEEEEAEVEEVAEEEKVKGSDDSAEMNIFQGRKKSDIEVYGKLHLPNHRNLSFTDSITSEPDHHMYWLNIPGIGGIVPERQILALKAFFTYWSQRQDGYVMPRNIKHHLCPSLEPPRDSHDVTDQEPSGLPKGSKDITDRKPTGLPKGSKDITDQKPSGLPKGSKDITDQEHSGSPRGS